MKDRDDSTMNTSTVTMENRYNDKGGIKEEDCVVDYGYEPVVSQCEFADASCSSSDSTPTSSLCLNNHQRRSSLKTSENYTPRPQRRASISYTGERKVKLSDNTIVRRRTSISFQDKDDVREIEPIESLTDETLWTTPVEYLRSKEEAKQVIRAIYRCYKKGGPKYHDEDEMCTRGLEHYLPGSRMRTQQSRSLVLKVQQSQKTAGMTCDETLSRLYSHMTLRSARDARQLGARDFAEVKHEHRITKRLINRDTTRRATMA